MHIWMSSTMHYPVFHKGLPQVPSRGIPKGHITNMHFRCISVLRARSEDVKVLAWRMVALRPNCPAHLNHY